MKKYITTSIGIIAGLSFGGFVAYATAHTSPMEYVSETWVQNEEVAEPEILADDIKTLPEPEVSNEAVSVTDAPALTSEAAPLLIETVPSNDQRYTYDDDDEDDEDDD